MDGCELLQIVSVKSLSFSDLLFVKPGCSFAVSVIMRRNFHSIPACKLASTTPELQSTYQLFIR